MALSYEIKKGVSMFVQVKDIKLDGVGPIDNRPSTD